MTNIKMSMRNKYETDECNICKIEDESQQLVYTCDKIWNIRGKIKENYPEYDNILNGNRKE